MHSGTNTFVYSYMYMYVNMYIGVMCVQYKHTDREQCLSANIMHAFVQGYIHNSYISA